MSLQVIQKGRGFTQDLMGGKLTLELLPGGTSSRKLEALVATVQPGVSSWERKRCCGNKWYYILEGQLNVLVGDASHILNEGDSIYLSSVDTHIWRNITEEATKVLVLGIP